LTTPIRTPRRLRFPPKGEPKPTATAPTTGGGHVPEPLPAPSGVSRRGRAALVLGNDPQFKSSGCVHFAALTARIRKGPLFVERLVVPLPLACYGYLQCDQPPDCQRATGSRGTRTGRWPGGEAVIMKTAPPRAQRRRDFIGSAV
jgi:hypothetical protein